MADPTITEPAGWQILERVAARLAAIRKASGYYTDAGLHVDLERHELTEADSYPRIALAEDLTTPRAQSATAINYETVIVAEGYQLADEAYAERAAMRLKVDLTRALVQTRPPDFAGITGAEVARFEVTGEAPTLRRPEGTAFIVVQVRARVAFAAYFPPAT